MRGLYELLEQQVDAGDWWPAESRFEIVVGAVLTQNTNWSNVEMAIQNLKEAGLLDEHRLVAADQEVITEQIRPAGYYNTKAGYLQNVSAWFIEHDQGASILDTATLRERLLGIRGVGEETADDLLLYVYERPVFIYDLYARRLLAAAGFGEFAGYRQAKQALDPIVAAVNFSVAELARFHGLIVDAGKLARKVGGWRYAYPLLVSRELVTAVEGI